MCLTVIVPLQVYTDELVLGFYLLNLVLWNIYYYRTWKWVNCDFICLLGQNLCSCLIICIWRKVLSAWRHPPRHCGRRQNTRPEKHQKTAKVAPHLYPRGYWGRGWPVCGWLHTYTHWHWFNNRPDALMDRMYSINALEFHLPRSRSWASV